MQKVIEFNDFNFRFYSVRDSDIYCLELPFFYRRQSQKLHRNACLQPEPESDCGQL